jgi:hypothetical protein
MNICRFCILNRLPAGRFGVRFAVRAQDLSLPPSLLFTGYRRFFPHEVKRQQREVNQCHPSRDEVKNEWSCRCNPLICLHGVDGDEFILYL